MYSKLDRLSIPFGRHICGNLVTTKCELSPIFSPILPDLKYNQVQSTNSSEQLCLFAQSRCKLMRLLHLVSIFYNGVYSIIFYTFRKYSICYTSKGNFNTLNSYMNKLCERHIGLCTWWLRQGILGSRSWWSHLWNLPRIEHPHELQEEVVVAAVVVAAAVAVDAERKQLLAAASAQGTGPLQRHWRWPRPAGQRRWLSSRSWLSPVVKEY